MRKYSFPDALSGWIKEKLAELNYPMSDKRVLAEAVVRLSDHFVSKRGPTPWNEKWAQAAYLAYFFPIGYVRGLAVRAQIPEVVFKDINSVFELGSGIGNVSAAFWAPEQKWFCEELSSFAKEQHRTLFRDVFSTKIEFHHSGERAGKKFDLGLFSFVLNEIPQIPDFDSFKTVVVMEPATHQDFLGFLNIRKKLLNAGFELLAPCPHAGICPMEGGRDWCHDRIGFDFPDWFEELQRNLPMKNRTVTFSYLVASKAITKAITGNESQARLVGDMLHENGKSKIMVCNGSERQFLSWLHKDGKAPELFRGDLFPLTKPYEVRGNEIRVKRTE